MGACVAAPHASALCVPWQGCGAAGSWAACASSWWCVSHHATLAEVLHHPALSCSAVTDHQASTWTASCCGTRAWTGWTRPTGTATSGVHVEHLQARLQAMQQLTARAVAVHDANGAGTTACLTLLPSLAATLQRQPIRRTLLGWHQPQPLRSALCQGELGCCGAGNDSWLPGMGACRRF